MSTAMRMTPHTGYAAMNRKFNRALTEARMTPHVNHQMAGADLVVGPVEDRDQALDDLEGRDEEHHAGGEPDPSSPGRALRRGRGWARRHAGVVRACSWSGNRRRGCRRGGRPGTGISHEDSSERMAGFPGHR